MTKHSRRARGKERWVNEHGRKRVFPSRRAAAREILRLWLDNREINLQMSWYWCKWGPDYSHGRSYPPHLHIGHDRAGKRRKKLKRIVHRWIVWPAKRTFIWPLLGFRTRIRNYTTSGTWKRHVHQ